MSRRPVALPAQIPFLHEKQIEREAEFLLAEYAEVMGPISVPPVPVEELPGFCTLNFKFMDLAEMFPFADVNGAIWFAEATVGIDSSLNPDQNPRRRGRYHFTLAHEIGHWRLHRQYYLTNPAERSLFDDGSRKPDVICRSSERKKPVEFQADAFAGCLLMPRKSVFAAWSQYFGTEAPVAIDDLRKKVADPFFHRGQILTAQDDKDIALKEEHCRPLADLFEVSREAMRIRLETLKLYVNMKEATLFD